MTYRIKNIGRVAALFVLLTLMQCSQQLAGAGSETTNGITGCIRNSDATPAVNAVVMLFSDDYDPVAGGGSGTYADTTDAAGAYRFSDIHTGRYNVLARGAKASSCLLVKGIVIAEDSTVSVASGNLGVSGAIAAGFSGGASGEAGDYLYIPGTDIFSCIGSDGTALLADVPPGQVATVVLATSGGEKRNVLHSEVTVVSGDTVIIRNPAWKYSRDVFFNTTGNGAGVVNDACDFPVLIRLTGENFSFAQAAEDGSDLLFNATNGSALPFEIERWDPATGLAEVWVTIDTLRGNSASQFITMYWGASTPSTSSGSSADPESDGSIVFDTTAGFTGVWHLGDAALDTIRDATGNRIHGVSPDSARPSIATGIIGNCRDFNGTTSFITMPNSAGGALNFSQNGQYTVSAWVYVETPDNHSHVIVSKGNTQYFLWHTPIHLNTTLWEYADYRNESGWDLSTAPISSGSWVLLTGVRDGTTQRLYVNGEAVDTLIDYPMVAPRYNASDLMIGRFAQVMASPNNDEGYCFFKGKIDEVRICGVARDANWVKLCYMNQRIDDELVIFK